MICPGKKRKILIVFGSRKSCFSKRKCATVMDYYLRFLQHFPTIAHLAQAPINEILRLWAGLGYYRRAHHLHHAAQILFVTHQENQGNLPQTETFWQSLPGVGRSTAASIVSSAFGNPAPILDGNVKRIYARVFSGKIHTANKDFSATALAAALWEKAEQMMSASMARENARQWNQALMDLGAIVCTPTPHCAKCPWNREILPGFCQYHLHQKDNHVRHLTKTAKSANTSTMVVTEPLLLLLMLAKNTIWLELRPAKGLWAGLWCAPLISVDTHDLGKSFFKKTAKLQVQTLSTVMIENASSEPIPLSHFSHKLTHRHFSVMPWLWQFDDVLTIKTNAHGEWIPLTKLTQYGIPVLMQKALAEAKRNMPSLFSVSAFPKGFR